MIFDIDNDKDLRVKVGDIVFEHAIIEEIVPWDHLTIGPKVKQSVQGIQISVEQYKEIAENGCVSKIIFKVPTVMSLGTHNDFEGDTLIFENKTDIHFINNHEIKNLHLSSHSSYVLQLHAHSKRFALTNTTIEAPCVIINDQPSAVLPVLNNSEIICNDLVINVLPGESPFREIAKRLHEDKLPIDEATKGYDLDSLFENMGILPKTCEHLLINIDKGDLDNWKLHFIPFRKFDKHGNFIDKQAKFLYINLRV